MSPGTLDMAGLMVTPLEKDFVEIAENDALVMLKEVAIKEDIVEQIIENIVQ